jgi:hypothetical protein
MKYRRNLRRTVVDFISSEEGGVDVDKAIVVGGIAFALLAGQVGGTNYLPVYGHHNYVVHSNFVEYVR